MRPLSYELMFRRFTIGKGNVFDYTFPGDNPVVITSGDSVTFYMSKDS